MNDVTRSKTACCADCHIRVACGVFDGFDRFQKWLDIIANSKSSEWPEEFKPLGVRVWMKTGHRLLTRS